MELPNQNFQLYQYVFPSHLVYPYHLTPENYVHWTETPESHIFSADLPGVRKEEIKVEVEDSIYLIIRTQRLDDGDEESTEARRTFTRKFRLPGTVDIERISAAYEDGVLTITVPRSLRRSFFIEPADMPERLDVLARAA
ncbi:putative small heat shock protein HSP20 [Rosa chinensis]|uniref:Putative small heat shock protein HSP20 n=1 Tax=Rosa chinensis TaxID=74649 RepID=A0A2P6Q2T9_ROSCH|nr:15.4 kDa class V heat shock protein [Rosa chinensis]PRQ28486.1 putative small heat shock protein HSP20 [Rosa chinensis]